MESRNTLLACAVILALTLLAYSNTFDASFQFDDSHQIVKNQNIRDLKNSYRFFSDAGMASYQLEAKGYRPLTFISFSINYAVSGYRTWSYHAFNLMLHIMNALLVFLVARRLLAVSGPGRRDWLALAAALIFALHPIQTGAVTYISGRAALLATLFYLAAFYCFLRFRAGDKDVGLRWYSWALLSYVLYLAALMSKEMAVSLPAVCVAYDLIFTVHKRGGFRKSMGAWLYYLPMLASLVFYLAARYDVTGYVAAPDFAYGAGAYLLTQAHVLLMYLRLLVLPVNQNADYLTPLTTSPDAYTAASALIVCMAVYLIYRFRSSAPLPAFFGAWFLLALMPESSVLPITDLAVEYRLYLPSIGFILSITMLADGLLVRRKVVRGALIIVMLAMLSILTFSRNMAWADDYTLWSDVVKKTPGSSRAHLNLGCALATKKQNAGAIAEFRRALEINPDYSEKDSVFNNIGQCLCEMGRYGEAIPEFGSAIETYPKCVEAYGNMGLAYYNMGRYKEAVDVLLKSLTVDPDYSPARFTLGQAYLKLGRFADAVREMEEAKKLSPQDYATRYNLAVMYMSAGRRDDAVAEARAALDCAMDTSEAAGAESLLRQVQGSS